MAYSKLEKRLKYTIIGLICQFKDEQTGLHICAKGIYDRSSGFEIIEQKACRSYDEQDSSIYRTVLLHIWRLAL
jgi:hypothetical protein